MAADKRKTVVLIHGLWFGRWAMWWLGWRLRKAGYATVFFPFHSVLGKFDDHALGLSEFTAALGVNPINVVAHSMGGLVTLRHLDLAPDAGIDRVVMLGSPLGGSSLARRIAKVPVLRVILGHGGRALMAGFQRIPEDVDCGMIAGTARIGLGMLAGGAAMPGDGTVATHEADAPGLTDRLEMPVTHTGLLTSRKVVEQTCRFLESGRFDH